jgi:hypothetical protein
MKTQRTVVTLLAQMTLLAAVLAACGRWHGGGVREGEADAAPWCGPMECHDVPDGWAREILGGLVFIRSFGSPCVMTVEWDLSDRTDYGFQAKFAAQKGDVLPSRRGLFELLSCDKLDPRGRPGKEFAILHYAIFFHGDHDLPTELAIAPDDVFIPLKGEASLDWEWVATAELVDSGGDGGLPSAAITVVHRSQPVSDVVHPRVRVGDTFRWSHRMATVVRIVEPQPPHLAGWIEVNPGVPPGGAE